MRSKERMHPLKFRMLVVSGHYRKVDDGVVIELFGRMEDGNSAAVRYHGFRPYFHIVEPGPEVESELRRDPLVKGIEALKLWHQGKDKECIKVTVTYPFDVPNYRKRWIDKGYTVLAADIPFIYRFYYDLDLGNYLEVEGEPATSKDYTAGIVVDAKAVRPVEPFKVKLKVLSIDIENSIRTGEIYMAGHSTCFLPMDAGEAIRSGSIVPPSSTEDRMEREDFVIQGIEDLIAREDPDIITGYNIDGYDIPHILRRCKELSIDGLTLGRDRSKIENMGFRSWRVRGRIVVDAWWEAKKAFRPKKETLESVSQLLLGEGKDDIDTAIIEEEWATRREEVIKYCEKDAALALRILDRTMAIKKGMDLSYVARLPLLDILSGTTSVMIDSIMIRAADRKGIGIPLTRHEQKTDKIEGAYVHSLEPGLYEWVVVLDFRSMYPSIMIENNICFTTITAEAQGSVRTPIPGLYFIPSEQRKGLVPELLEGLMRDRIESKKRMKAAINDAEREYYNGLQEAIKVLMNSFYGVFASYFYRFTDRSIGSSITAFARENITGLISKLGSEGSKVIYSDTDSVFILSPFRELEKTLAFGRDLSSRFSEGIRVLEFEKVFRSFFSHGKKKRYVGKVIWPIEDMVVRGYEMRRTDSFDLQSDSLMELFEMILSGNEDEALEFARSVVRDVRMGKVPTEKLVISRSVQEVEEDKIRESYKNPDSLSNVQALRKIRKQGIELVPGMKVSWIVVDAREKPQKVEPYIDGREFAFRPDYNYYAERLSSTLARVTEMFGVEEKELLSGVAQSSLFDQFEKDEGEGEQGEKATEGDKDRRGKRDEPARDTGSMTLDRWM